MEWRKNIDLVVPARSLRIDGCRQRSARTGSG